MNFLSSLHFSDSFPQDFFDGEKDLLIIDQQVDQMMPELAKKFQYVYRVSAGEDLKSLSSFAHHVEMILDLWQVSLSRQNRIVSCGGGSVGDFSGFLASILKRGLRLVQCPTTWLSAIDSAHGGKTALNVKSIKNQVGTFYPAESIVLVREILFLQNQDRAREGMGELLKIALTSPTDLFKKIQPPQSHADLLWHNLHDAIEAKNHIVLQDPYETLGTRKILNLGHTLGHALESYYKVAHGEGVLQGLYFAVEWSAKSGLLAESRRDEIVSRFHHLQLPCWLNKNEPQKMTARELKQLIVYDKKMNVQGMIDFIFLTNIGEAKVLAVSVDELVHEALRQGWVRDV